MALIRHKGPQIEDDAFPYGQIFFMPLSLLGLHPVYTHCASLMWLCPMCRQTTDQLILCRAHSSVQLSKPRHSCDLGGRDRERKGCKLVQYFRLYCCLPLPDLQLAEKKHQGKVTSCSEQFQVRHVLEVASNVTGRNWRGHASIYCLTVTSSDILTRCHSDNTFSVPDTM